MKNIMLMCMIFASCNIFAQNTIKEKYYGKDSIPKFILFEETNYKSGMDASLFKEQLKLTSDDDFKLIVEFEDELGETLKKYRQYYKGIKVEYGDYRIHLRQGKLKAISGNYVKPVKISTKPVLSEQSALDMALKQVNAKTYLWDYSGMEKWLKQEQNNEDATLYPKGELIIWNNINNTVFKLAYKFDIYAVEPLSREYVFIDAQTGELLEKEPILKNAIATGTLTTRYSGVRTSVTEMTSSTSFRLADLSRGNGITTKDMKRGDNFSLAEDFVDNNNVWTAAEWHNSNEDDAALEAHWALQQTYDYFKSVHNRNSYNNNGAAINCYVHFRVNFENGYWDGSRIVLGDGNFIFDNICSLDVLAHEFGHAICEYTCDLRYQKESGAINEGLSDIWGVCVENFAAPEKQTWRIGEDNILTAPAYRYLDEPNLGSQPDTYGGTHWIDPDCTYPVEYNDYCGVHTNSGVLNHWFYLLVNGGSGTNDNGDFYYFDGININSAAKIVYRMETVYLNSSSDFADARIFATQAARDLYGTNSTATYAVESAWYAVGVGSPANQLNNSIVGPTQLTPGYSATYSITRNVDATSYSWIIPSGCYANYCWAIRIGQGTPQISVMAGAVGSGTITCRVYQGSILIDSKSLDINVQNPYDGGGSGDSDPCNDGGDDIYLEIIHGVIYPPEPCDENDYLVFEQRSFVSIEVFNLMGQKIMKSVNLTEFDTSCLPAGVFIIKALTNDGKSYSEKIIRN